MELTWIAILASLSMALAAVCIFILAGAGTMLAFGAGTAVALLCIGAASSFVRLPRWNNRLAAFMMPAGALLVWRGLTAPVCHGRTGVPACPPWIASLLK